jgi:putative hydrolase of the HAD superfamily
MTIQVHGTNNIDAILFDMNGTLRRRELHPPTQQVAIKRMLDLLEKKDAPDAFWEELERRYKAYGYWAQENLLQLTEKEIWTRWLLPDAPCNQIEPLAEELTLAWKKTRGRTVPLEGAEETLLELKRRGYRLGVISNSMSSLDIPQSLQAFGWKDYFEVVILSSLVRYRKPAPEIFWEATSAMNIEPPQCAYLGNRISRDVIGCKRAGFALGIIIEAPGKSYADEQDQAIQPDVVIHSLSDLLALFPLRVLQELKA